ncbi:phage antirepressor protein [Clostridioides difficile]|nr:phage antirepressor protein [Clostridioides difficile]
MNNLQIFKNKTFGEIRVIELNGEFWFVGKDIAE